MSAAKTMKSRDSVEPRTVSGVRLAIESPPSSRSPRIRRDDRVLTHLPVRMLVEGEVAEGLCVNLSLGGMAIASEHRVRVGSMVRVWLSLDDAEVYFAGIVRWTKEGELGVQHQKVGARDTYLLTEFLAHG